MRLGDGVDELIDVPSCSLSVVVPCGCEPDRWYRGLQKPFDVDVDFGGGGPYGAAVAGEAAARPPQLTLLSVILRRLGVGI